MRSMVEGGAACAERGTVRTEPEVGVLPYADGVGGVARAA